MPTLTLADRVAETTTTTGTGTLDLAGAVGGAFRTFVAGAGTGAVVPYVIVHRSANEWEVGYGTVTDATPDTLTRTAVYASSNANALVDFSAGTKDVFLALPASRTLRLDTDGNFSVDTNTLYVDAVNNRVGIGTASPIYNAQLQGASPVLNINGTGTTTATLFGTVSGGTNGVTAIRTLNGGILAFDTGATGAAQVERARITAGGYLKASNDGTYAASAGNYHEINSSEPSTSVLQVSNTSATPRGMGVLFSAAAPDDNTSFFYRGDDSVTLRFIVYSDGDVLNHDGVYGTISDAKLKQDITDAGSQWDDLKAIRFRKYRFKSDVAQKGESAPYLLGVVAQELRESSPGLVDAHPDTEQVEVVGEDGETRTETRLTGTETLSVKQSVLLMKAAAALQEAMARIETLEAQVARLEARAT